MGEGQVLCRSGFAGATQEETGEIVRGGIAGLLGAQPDLVIAGEAASGDEAVRLATELVPDVMLVDLVMPGMDGVEATARVRRVSPRTQVVV